MFDWPGLVMGIFDRTMRRQESPDLVPVLSPGKHRNPKKGAYFMEYASFLAGERWSDHPSCTHPLLALLARGVNDHTSAEGRPRLVPLIPAVVGTNGDSPAIDVSIAIRSAAAALPIAASERQRALSVGLFVSIDVLRLSRSDLAATQYEELASVAAAALNGAPQAKAWARSFVDSQPSRREVFVTRSAPAIVRAAVTGIADAGSADRDQRLYRLLLSAIEDCQMVLDRGSRDAHRARPNGVAVWV